MPGPPKISSPEARAKMTPKQRMDEVTAYENYRAPGDALTNRERAQASLHMEDANREAAAKKKKSTPGKKFASGGSVRRADGIAMRGKTKGKMC